MKTLFVPFAVLALSACSSQESAPAPSPTAAPVVETTPTLPAPDKAAFSAAYAEACPKAKKVNNADCKSEGFGKHGFVCGFGLGDDTYPRNNATLKPGDGKWVLADPETACSAK